MRTLPFRRIVLLACLGCLVFSGASFGVTAKPAAFSISVKVVGPDGKGWPKAEVSVKDLRRDDDPVKEISDPGGIARFYGLRGGLHHLRITGKEINDFETVVQVSPDEIAHECWISIPCPQSSVVINPVPDWIEHPKERTPPDQDENADEPPPANALFAAMGEDSDDDKAFDLDRIAEVLKSGIQPDESNAFGDTPLMLAAGSNKPNAPALVTLLLKAGADPNAKNRFGTTPLMYALMPRGAEALKILVAAGTKPDQPDAGGRTALMFSACGGDAARTRILLKAGARIEATDKFGQSPRDYAKAGLSLSLGRDSETTRVFNLLGLETHNMVDDDEETSEGPR